MKKRNRKIQIDEVVVNHESSIRFYLHSRSANNDARLIRYAAEEFNAAMLSTYRDPGTLRRVAHYVAPKAQAGSFIAKVKDILELN